MKFFEDLLIHADAGSVVNLTTNGTTGTVNAYTGVYDASETTTKSMSATMKEYYDTELLENAREKLIYSQLGKQQRLPIKHGKVVQWRKWNTFDKAMTPLQEGVIPPGQKFGITETSVEIQQYGDYTTISDQLEMHAIDPVILARPRRWAPRAARLPTPWSATCWPPAPPSSTPTPWTPTACLPAPPWAATRWPRPTTA